jgi:hypothetical protein
VFDRIGLFNPDLRFGEDMDWYMRARGQGVSIAGIEDICLSIGCMKTT